MSHVKGGSSTIDTSNAAEYLRLLIESQPDYAIFVLDADGHVVTWNPGARRFKGYAAHEIIGRHFSVFYPPEQVAAGKPQELVEARARTGGSRTRAGVSARTGAVLGQRRHHRAARRTRRAGRVREGHARSHRRQLATSSCGGGRGAADRQSERAVPAAGRERARLRDLHARLTGRIPTWNAGAERIKGYTADEIIGRHFERSTPSRARVRPASRDELEVAAREGRFEDEGWRVRKDGSQFWANVVITALHDARGHAHRLREGHARPDRATPGAAAAREVRARRPS